MSSLSMLGILASFGACLSEGMTHHSLSTSPSQDLKTVFLINCGAMEDIKAIYKFSHLVRIIILDSHRPVYHGYNTAVGGIPMQPLLDHAAPPSPCSLMQPHATTGGAGCCGWLNTV